MKYTLFFFIMLAILTACGSNKSNVKTVVEFEEQNVDKKPTKDDLSGIDVVLFDIQDVGLRFYTYISTLHLVMEACAENDVKLIVLDRPNPHGFYIDGPVLEKEFSYVYTIPKTWIGGGKYTIQIWGYDAVNNLSLPAEIVMTVK